MTSNSNPKIFHICFYLTYRCNLACQGCLRLAPRLSYLKDNQRKDMSFDHFKKILELCPNTKDITMAGIGEPLLNKDFFSMIDYALESGLSIFLCSNFLSIKDQKFKKILHDNLHINISLKAKNEKDFVKNTRSNKENYHKQLANIKKLVVAKKAKGSQGIITLSYVVGVHNFKDMEKVIQTGKQLGVDKILFNNFLSYYSDKNKKSIFENNFKIKIYIQYLKHKYKNLDIDFPILIKKKNFSYYCSSCDWMLVVDGLGNVSPCTWQIEPQAKFGNIFVDKDIMNTDHYKKIKEEHANKSLNDLCKICIETSRNKKNIQTLS